jgi:hypothetical protein
MTFKYVIAILIIMAFILPSSAMVNLTYPDEYYNLKSISDNSIGQLSKSVNGWNTGWAESATAMATQLSFIELHRQSILMEKQNELLAEQNTLLRKLVKDDNSNGLIYYNSQITLPDGCYQNETGQDPNDLVMHFTCPDDVRI